MRATSGPTSTSTSSTDSSVTPPGCRCAGINPADHSARSRSVSNTSPSSLAELPKKESEMPEAYVIDAVRTAVGKRNGALAGIHPVDLGALGWRGLLDRCDVDPAAVDDVIAGCVDAIGGQAGNIARLSWLAAGYSEEVPGVTVDRQCGSSQQAISFGAQAIMAGTADLIVAGGGQNMSQIPISSASSSASPRRPMNPSSGCTDTAIRKSRSSVARS